MAEKRPILSTVLFSLIVIAIMAILYLLLIKKDDDKKVEDKTVEPTIEVTQAPQDDGTTTPTVTKKAEATPTKIKESESGDSKDIALPEGWEAIENTFQEYTAYRPKGFYYRLFPPNMYLLGVDPNPIPIATEYAGVITLLRTNSTNNLEGRLKDLKAGYTEKNVVFNSLEWRIIDGETKDTEMYDSYKVRYAYIKINGKEFLATLERETSKYSDTFNTFIANIKFD